jgi:RecQ family ATP-dependent DNA helicase
VQYSLENKDILTILSTWWWKSLIYQLPARIIWEELWQLTLVITPLKALIKDQIDWLQSKWFNEVKYFSGDQSNLEKQIIREKIKSWETKLLFLTPESLRSEKNFEFLKNRYISRIVVDEAHTLILWWAEFRPDYFFIKTFLEDLEKENLNKHINITLLTATAPVDVEIGLKKYFNNKVFEIIKQDNILKKNIKASVINIENKKDKIEILIKKIKEINVSKNPTIIFAWERQTTEELANHLNSEWIKTEFFHAWIPLNKKKEIQENFISWKLNIIVATKAFWMWIDKDNVRYVIHYDLPWNIEDYLQEIWRAWRDWKLSKNIIFYSKKEITEKLKQLNNININNLNILWFIKNIKLNKKKLKLVLSPRQIANFSWIKTDKKNYITNIKLLLNFLEREKIFNQKNILERKYDNIFILFDKIENYKINKNYQIIENNNFLNKYEKDLAKWIVWKIINEKKAIDLNKLEEVFKNDLWKDFNYKNINIRKIANQIKSLNILWKSENNEELEFVIEGTKLLTSWNYFWETEDKFWKIFNIFWKNLKNNLEIKQNNFYEQIKNYYLFKNYIKEKNWRIIIKNKNLKIHFKNNSELGQIILDYIFKNDFKNKKIINIIDLLKFLQNNFDKNIWISSLKENLFFLHMLGIIKVKNWLIVFLTRYTLEFDKNILELKEKIKINDFKKKFKSELKNKLDKYIEMKKNKLLALQLLVKNLEVFWEKRYLDLAKNYFSTSLDEFSERFLKQKKDEYEEYLLK